MPQGYVVGVKSALSLPVPVEGEFFGTLGFGSRAIGQYTEDTVRFLVAISAIVGMMIGEAKVQERSIRSNTLLEEAPLGMVVVDDDGLIVQNNRYLEDLFGYERKELVGSSIEILVAESLKHAHTSHRAGYIQNPASRPMGEGLQLLGQRKDGSEFPVVIGLNTIDTPDGHVTLDHVADDTYRSELEEFLKATGARLGDRLEAREAEMAVVDQVAKIITSTLDIDQVFEKFVDEVRTLVDFNIAAINIIDRDGEKVIAKRFVWTGSLKTEPQVTLDLKGTLTYQAMLTGQTIIQDGIIESAGFNANGFFNERDLRSGILTPLVYNNLVIGSMGLASNSPNVFGPGNSASWSAWPVRSHRRWKMPGCTRRLRSAPGKSNALAGSPTGFPPATRRHWQSSEETTGR